MFILCGQNYKDANFGNVAKGLTLVATINFASGMLSMINQWTKKMLNISLDKGITVKSLIPENIEQTNLSIKLPGSVTYVVNGIDSGDLPIEIFDINLDINSKGLIGQAYIKPITLSGVTITGPASSPGIAIDFDFDLWNFWQISKLLLTFDTQTLAQLTKLKVTGDISIKAPAIGKILSGPAEINLSKDGIDAKFNTPLIKNFLNLDITAKTDMKNLSDWIISGSVNQTALEAFKNKLNKSAQEFLNKATTEINNAKAKVTEKQKVISDLKVKKNKIEQENLENINRAQANLENKIKDLNNLKSQLEEAKRKCGS